MPLPKILVLMTLSGVLSAADHLPVLAPEDQEFLRESAVYHVVEVRAAEMALERSASDEIRAFAMIVRDRNTTALRQLVGIAVRRSLPFANRLPAEVEKDLAALRAAGDFERRFIDHQVSVHRQALRALTCATASHDEEIRLYAKAGMIAVDHHLDIAHYLIARY